ncbi:hypothetical protein DS832_07375 [Bombilactobacillus bombi]|uniref:Uncharacterized protein n=1 Tax=Bombilactobacillus bombi TaxID=1303590 RepID=A0A3R6ZUQ3_9LACO|nr:hypothetical protein [Bombilactobacillus bombi]RHW45632.1 hypothetical protein DS832_07375 [Bombilactobacillus bombi]
MIYTVLFGIYFIICQIIVSNKKISNFLQSRRASKITLVSVIIIALSIFISSVMNLNYLFPVLVTIFMGSIIFDKYMQIFEKLEKGEKI